MSPVVAVAAGTMLVLAGLIGAVAAVRPAPPALAATLAQVRAAPVLQETAATVAARPARYERVLARMSGRIAQADLEILGRTRAQVSTSRFAACGVAVAAPTLLGAFAALAGLGIGWAIPAGFGLALAVVAWFVQEQSLHTAAEALRAQFLAALTSYLALVALERQVRGSPVEALHEAASLSPAWPFRLIAAELVRAEACGIAPWEGLRQLGERIGVERLRSLADIAAAAADGAGVFSSLMAEARSLRAAELTTAHAKANAVSEQLGQPLALLALSTLVLGILPALLRLLSS